MATRGSPRSTVQRSWQADRRPGQDTEVAEWRQEDPGSMPAGDIYGGGSPTGVTMYENGALGEKWNGLLLACEAGRNVIFGYFPKPDGAGFKLERFDFITSNPARQFAGSDFVQGKVNREIRTWFRPADVTVGPDGAIYVADWFDPRVGGHADLDDSTSGTIYRIAPKGFKPRIPKIDLTTTAGQIEALRSPAVNVRNSGFTRLKAQGERAVPAVAALLTDENPYLAARAVWLLAQLGPSGVALVKPMLVSGTDNQRLVAYRALRRAGQDVVALAAQAAVDRSPAIRRDAALMLRDVPSARSRDLLIQIARQYDGRDRSYLEAFGTGCEGKEAEIYAALRREQPQDPVQWTPAFADLAWRLHVVDAAGDFKTRARSAALPASERKRALTALAFMPSLAAATAVVDLATDASFPAVEEAKWWLGNRMGNTWEPFQVGELMESRGLENPEKRPLTSITMPTAPAGAKPLGPVASILALTGDVERGKVAITSCYLCHKIGRNGNDFGPNLTTFGKQQPREVILRGILEPSADIAFGYQGSRIETVDGTIIDGIVLSSRNPVTIRSMGGTTQQVWKRRIKSITPLETSLMFSPELLGLTPQMVADITAYLQSDIER
jgi:putative heme-binding domain-containing protein